VPWVHASSVAIDHRAVLITGAPGSGKSSLALRLIEQGAELIADDQTVLSHDDGEGVWRASAPPAIRGKLMPRGMDMLTLSFADGLPVALCLRLISADVASGEEKGPTPQEVSPGIFIPTLTFGAETPQAMRSVRLVLAALEAARTKSQS